MLNPKDDKTLIKVNIKMFTPSYTKQTLNTDVELTHLQCRLLRDIVISLAKVNEYLKNN